MRLVDDVVSNSNLDLKRPLRLVYVTSTLPTGPGETFIYPEIQALRHRGHEVLVVPLRPRRQIFHREGKVLRPHSRIEGLFSVRVILSAIGALLRAPRRAFRACKVLLTGNPKHLLKNLVVFPKALWLGTIAADWGAVHIHSHWVATTASLAMAASEYSGIPWSFTAHRWDIRENNLIRRKIGHSRFARFISRRGIQTAREQHALPDEKGKVHVVHMGVPFDHDQNNRITSLVPPNDRFRIICPANLIPIKGHEYLLRAIAKLDDIEGLELWLAGDGPLQQPLEQLARQLGISNTVRFLGRLDHAALMQLYRNGEVDLICLASLELGHGVHEGIPVALIEAMSYGIPAVATRSGGIEELLGGGAGLLVTPGDAEELANAIRRLHADKHLYRELKVIGRDQVRKRFAIDVVAKELERLFIGRG